MDTSLLTRNSSSVSCIPSRLFSWFLASAMLNNLLYAFDGIVKLMLVWLCVSGEWGFVSRRKEPMDLTHLHP